MCERNDYLILKKFVDLEKFDKVEYPKKFIEEINFSKCFNIAYKNNNEKIAKYLLKILSCYCFELNRKDIVNVDKTKKLNELMKNLIEKLYMRKN